MSTTVHTGQACQLAAKKTVELLGAVVLGEDGQGQVVRPPSRSRVGGSLDGLLGDLFLLAAFPQPWLL